MSVNHYTQRTWASLGFRVEISGLRRVAIEPARPIHHLSLPDQLMEGLNSIGDIGYVSGRDRDAIFGTRLEQLELRRSGVEFGIGPLYPSPGELNCSQPSALFLSANFWPSDSLYVPLLAITSCGRT